MSGESDTTLQVEKTVSLVNLNQRLTTVCDRKCLVFPTKISKSDYIRVMQNADAHPEFINDTPPSKPGFGSCEIFAMDKNLDKTELGLDDYTPWHKGGSKRSLEWQHSYFYFLNANGNFEPSKKASATHVLRISAFVLATCNSLTKKIFRMLKMDDLTQHCIPSLIVYTFLGGDPPAPNSAVVLKRDALDDILNSNISPQKSVPSTTANLKSRIRRSIFLQDSEEPKAKNPRMSNSSSLREPKIEPLEVTLKVRTETVVKEENISDDSINNRASSSNVQMPVESSSPVTQHHSNYQNQNFQNYEMFSAGVISNATVPSPMVHPHITPIADLEDNERMEPDELVQRNKLASLYRLVDLFRWSQGIYNHITVRVSSNPDEILINAFGQFYNEVSASSLIKVDLDGTVIDGGSTKFGVNQAGYVLHSAVHGARPEVKCVVHLHHPSVVAVSAQKCGLLPISQEAMIVGEVGYHEYRGILIDEAERALLVRDLGERNVMILRNHGFVVCGESVEHALSLTYHLIIACETQVKAVPGGNTDNVHFPAQSAIKQVYQVASNGGGGVNRQNGHVNSTQWRKGQLEWEAYMRQLDAQGYVTGHIYD